MLLSDVGKEHWSPPASHKDELRDLYGRCPGVYKFYCRMSSTAFLPRKNITEIKHLVLRLSASRQRENGRGRL